MTFRAAVLATALLGASAVAVPAAAARAQASAEHVALGDRDRAANPAAALRHYEAATEAEPRSYEALWKASAAAIEAAEVATGPEERRATLARMAERYARKAIEVNPGHGEGHFALARALGRAAQAAPSRERIRYAADVRTHALEALRLAPRHAGAMHVLGMWNAEVMRLNGVARFMAKNFLGGQVFGSASWDDAQRYLEQAVALEPSRLVHRIDLAEIYADRGNAAKAREQTAFIAQAPTTEASDARYKRDAQALARRLR